VRAWTSNDLPDQSGRTVVITGATSGIGQATAGALAGAGARVVLAVRDPEKGAATADLIEREHPGAIVQVRPLDLADLSSVRGFVRAWSGPVDVVINNAGVMALRPQHTVDGFELQFGTNHLGHFALSTLLLPVITDRVITVSSDAHRWAHLDLDDPNWQRRRYRAWQAYGQSKLANLLFTLELDRRLRTSGRRALAVHPGWVRTRLGTGRLGAPAVAVSRVVGSIFGQSAERGAWSSLYAATQDLPGGSFVGPDGPAGNRGRPCLIGRSAAASDPELAVRLWTLSERLTAAS
jgi:NAD(P)-dependent dehydrogenase (short-subunit alcohol dehydrogenase family)